MRNLRRLSCLGATILTSIGVLAGCGSGTGGDGPDGGDDSSLGTGATPGAGGGANPGVGGSGNPNAGGSGGGINGTGGTIDPTVCVPGVPASSQVPRLLNRQYEKAVFELVGVTAVGTPALPPSQILTTDSEGSLDIYGWKAYQDAADAIAKQVMADPAKKAKFIGCSAAEVQCLTDTINSFGRKAFRRPLTEAEVSGFLAFNSLTPAPSSPDEVAEAILFAFLVSPSFILLPELAVDEQEGGGTKLNDYEVATRLAITLWGSIPDDALAQAADDGLLGTKEQVLAQAQRMVADRARTAPLVSAFHHEYFEMDLERWKTLTHDPELYPEYTEATRAASHAEVEALTEEIAFEGGSFSDLFLSNVGFVNKDTAAIYGLNAADYGDALERVELDAQKRPGVLTRVGFLAAYSSYATTNPILRGAFVTANMMGISFKPPPDGAAQTQDPTGPFATYRELIEEKTSPGPCIECHSTYINPPGFVLEKYDSIGKWQDTDRWGGEITGAADVTISQDLTKKPINGPRALMEEIGLGERAQWNYVQHWIKFLTNRLANASDNCTVLDLGAQLSTDGYTILNLLTDLTQTDSFRTRTTSP